MDRLKYISLLILPLFVLLTVFPQIQHRSQDIVIPAPPREIITGVEIDGVHYFLKFVPMDSHRIREGQTFPERYPQYFFRDDTLHYVLPDTVLKFVPKFRLDPGE